jgi:hypothetical protein
LQGRPTQSTRPCIDPASLPVSTSRAVSKVRLMEARTHYFTGTSVSQAIGGLYGSSTVTSSRLDLVPSQPPSIGAHAFLSPNRTGVSQSTVDPASRLGGKSQQYSTTSSASEDSGRVGQHANTDTTRVSLSYPPTQNVTASRGTPGQSQAPKKFISSFARRHKASTRRGRVTNLDPTEDEQR